MNGFEHRPTVCRDARASVLLIDDDIQLSALLSELLLAHGYAAEATTDRKSAARRVRGGEFDLVILGLTVPVDSAVEQLQRLQRLQQHAQLPVLVVAAGMGEPDRIALLESGADDCLAKPFNPRELLLRVKAVLRRCSATATAGLPTLRVGPLLLDVAAQTLTIREQQIRLTGAEARLLEALMLSAGRTVSRIRLTEYGLGRASSPYDRALDTHISNLRLKLGSDERGTTPIKTLRGSGYVLLPQWEPGERAPLKT